MEDIFYQTLKNNLRTGLCNLKKKKIDADQKAKSNTPN